MASGGVRQGQPGKQYPNRTDMAQGVRAASGQAYGERKAQEDAQRAIPLPQVPQAVPLNAPTQRPDEPVTAGLPFGPGPGPAVLGLPGTDDPAEHILALYRKFPSNDLLRLLDAYRRGD